MSIIRKNPNQVDTRTTRVLMEVAELHRKHLGGQLLFGPDGLLHIFLGDGMITLDDMEEMDGLRYIKYLNSRIKFLLINILGRPRLDVTNYCT